MLIGYTTLVWHRDSEYLGVKGKQYVSDDVDTIYYYNE